MKKVVSTLLAAALALGMTVPALAADRGANSQIQDLSVGYSEDVGNNSIDLGTIRPKDEVTKYIYLYEDMFDWEDGHTGTPGQLLTRGQINDSKLKIRTTGSKGLKAIKDISIDTSKSRIEVEFVDEYVSTNDLDFEITVYLTIDSSSQKEYGITFTGTLENEEVEAEEDDTYHDLSDGDVVEANAFIKDAELYLGNGVTMYAKLYNGKKYYGTANNDIKDEDADIVTQYPDISEIYYLNTINLNSTSNYVNFDIDDTFYVYNTDLEYIGTTRDDLPYSTKYYLANKELDVDTAEDDLIEEPLDADDTTESYESGEDMGGDDLVPDNYNDNPGTGR
ncbi:hypothetical protein LJC63_12710 [Ruminococcaceae bacterium OttesenSCG-928-L11]|nr:hypothetical protein [Ruminococcaceae bacterium OttesenSCG-928-L11]